MNPPTLTPAIPAPDATPTPADGRDVGDDRPEHTKTDAELAAERAAQD